MCTYMHFIDGLVAASDGLRLVLGFGLGRVEGTGGVMMCSDVIGEEVWVRRGKAVDE